MILRGNILSQTLAAPILAIVGGRDVLIDSVQTRDRLGRFAPRAEVRFIPEARHFIPGQTQHVMDFLDNSIKF
jgi:pimeloyl-ACP methyl ester carboxylesterase